MSIHGERDQVIDRLLRDAASSGVGPGGATPACVAPETLAAWIDGGLPVTVMAQVEAHLADCAHCQAVLATFAASEPAAVAAAPAVVPFWSRWSLRWTVPMAAGIALVLTWSVLQLQAPTDTPEQTMARVEPVAEPVPSESLSQPLVVPPPPVPSATTPADERQSSAFRADDARSQMRNEQAFAKAELPATTLARPAPAAPAAAAPPPPPPAVGAARSVEVQAPPESAPAARMMDQVTAVAEAPARLATAPTAIVAEFAVGTIADETRVLRAEPPAPGAQAAGRGRAASSASALRQTAVPAIARWRVSATGAVERQVVSSSVWEPVAISPPATVLNGAAPSALVCWLVGRDGLVLRTTNGNAFTRISFPEAVDLLSVTATSAQAARVTAANGRTFETTDGGATWR